MDCAGSSTILPMLALGASSGRTGDRITPAQIAVSCDFAVRSKAVIVVTICRLACRYVRTGPDQEALEPLNVISSASPLEERR